MKHTPIAQNFIYPEIKETDFLFGSGQLVGEILRPDSNWEDYLPPEEEQRRNGIESSSCFTQGCQHPLATLQEEIYDIKDQNYSERFTALLAGGTPNGGNPIKAGESIRRDGLIPDSMLPFSDDIYSWDEFHSFKGQSESLCRLTGKGWRQQWDPRFDIVFTKNEQVESKYAKIAEALKYSPLSVSVNAWYEKDGVYVKPAGTSDNHFVELYKLEPDGSAWIWDTYPPFRKKLDKWYNFDLGMRWSITRITPSPSKPKFSIMNILINWLKEIWK